MKIVEGVYVASATEQLALVEKYVDRLREWGFTITYEWTKDVREAGFKSDSELSDIQRRYAARMDSHGVATCEMLWVLTPQSKNEGCGMWIELGMALALKKRVIISGPQARRSVFSELCEARFETHEEAFKYLLAKGSDE